MGIVTQAMYLPSDVLEELSAFSGHFWSSWEQEPVICDAIRAYIKPKPAEQLQAVAPASDRGYQWKQLFLPDGTRLRASYGREAYFAEVEGSDIRCDGRSLSPSGFANLRGSGNRNAWKAVWLRFPGSPQWVLAAACRTLQQAAAERLFEPATAQPASTARPAPDRAANRDYPSGIGGVTRRGVAAAIGAIDAKSTPSITGPGSLHAGIPDYLQAILQKPKRKPRRGKRRHKRPAQ